MQQQSKPQKNKNRHGNTEEGSHAEFAIEGVFRLNLSRIADVEGERTENRHGAQGNNEGGYLSPGDHDAVKGTGTSPHQDSRKDSCQKHHKFVGEHREKAVHGDNHHRPGKSHHGTHGEIDPRRDDNEGHPQTDDPGIGNLPHDVDEVSGLQKIGAQK